MTRADLAELIGIKLGVNTGSRSRDAIVPPGVLVEPGGWEPLTLCWSEQATVRVIAGRADDLDVYEVCDDLVRELIGLLINTRGVTIVGSIAAPAVETLGGVDHYTTTITVGLGD